MNPKQSEGAPYTSTPPSGTIMSQSLDVQGEALITQMLNSLQGLLAVVNGERRVVFANSAFLDFVNRGGLEDVRGLRPGVIFHCAHAAKGCGESEDCRLCGAKQAMEEALASGKPSTRDFRLIGDGGSDLIPMDFRVRAIPFKLSANSYVLVSLRDVSGEKRKAALERIFFHDILNTASSMKMYLDLLRAGITEESSRQLLERLSSINDALVEEIKSQKILVSAENKTLTVQKHLISSAGMVEQLVRQFDEQDLSRGKKIVTAPFSEDIALISDDSLLRRVLANALKNALEASRKGDTITIGFGARDGKARFWVTNPGHMEETVKSRVFQRYFSTKGEDRGLGTYGMKLLTEAYLGGEVEFESVPEKGTTFTVTLPLKP